MYQNNSELIHTQQTCKYAMWNISEHRHTDTQLTCIDITNE